MTPQIEPTDLVGTTPKPVSQILRETNRMARKRWGLKTYPRMDSVQIYTIKGNHEQSRGRGVFTVAVIPSARKNPKAIGVAKYNPKDPYSREVGIRVAYAAALRSLVDNTTEEIHTEDVTVP